ncbi:MAG: HEAT repeat domain-containing protein [Candidatus Heimdallarchaeota archaeon]|nr:HEAT repeat domain-containing protein [Candidatus Heimdallarchaeota archaeon]MCK4877599.1 HEAT repeat domain-containing protein [Candidatus Heimdallarchaeota archaeon]
MTEEEIVKNIKLMQNENPALRQLALEQLAQFTGNHQAVDAIIKSLQDNDKDVRSYAADILGETSERQALIALSHSLEDTAWEVRKSTISSFGKIKNPDTVPFIVTALKDEHPQVRYSAAKELKRFTSPSVIRPLFEALKDETESVREEAKSTLLNFSVNVPASMVAGFLLDTNKLVREVVVEFLTSRVEGNPIPHLERACQDKEWDIRFLALKELSKVIQKLEGTDSELVEINLSALNDENARVRYQAISNLGLLNDPNSLDLLGEIAINDEDSNNRLMATETMTSIRRALRLEE